MIIILTVESALDFIKITNKLHYFKFYNHRKNFIIFFVNFYCEWTKFPFIICNVLHCLMYPNYKDLHNGRKETLGILSQRLCVKMSLTT